MEHQWQELQYSISWATCLKFGQCCSTRIMNANLLLLPAWIKISNVFHGRTSYTVMQPTNWHAYDLVPPASKNGCNATMHCHSLRKLVQGNDPRNDSVGEKKPARYCFLTSQLTMMTSLKYLKRQLSNRIKPAVLITSRCCSMR